MKKIEAEKKLLEYIKEKDLVGIRACMEKEETAIIYTIVFN